VHTSIGGGGWALAALVLVQALLQSALGRRWVWDHIADPHGLMPKIGEPWVLCPDCDLVAPAPVPGGSLRCPRCAGRLEPRRPGSLAAAAALTIAAYILYLPANLLPVITILHFGQSETNTIVGGVTELAQLGMWPLALLVLFASIIVPVVKLVTLSWFLVTIRLGSRRLLHQRTHCYRLIEFIGRWSTIDVFMVSILAALLRFGTLTTVYPDGGIVSFAAVVVLTMVATRVFDPRLMWDAARRVAP
jgi:paraquat-inducible protein A